MTGGLRFLALFRPVGRLRVVLGSPRSSMQTPSNSGLYVGSFVGLIALMTGLFAALVPLSAVAATSGSTYVPLAPARICDTRSSSVSGLSDQCTGEALTAGGTLTVQVTGNGEVPATGVSAVMANVTVTGTTTSGYLTVWPAGATRPTASNLNWSPGDTVANLVAVPVSPSGQISVYNSAGSTNVIVDVEGYTSTTGTGTAGLSESLTPARICDTRSSLVSGLSDQCTGNTLGGGNTLTVQVTGNGGVSATGVSAVMANVTVTGTTTSGYLTVWPAGSTQPTASNLNWSPGDTVANLVAVPVSPSGQISVYNSAGSTNVIVDVESWYTDGSNPTAVGDGDVPLSPARICDTRASSVSGLSDQCTGNTMAAGGTLGVQVTGQGGVPASGVSAVLANVTVTGTTSPGYLTVWPAGSTQPTASNLNWSPGDTVANLVAVPMSASGQISVFNSSGSTDVIIDVVGYETSPVPQLVITTGALPSGTVGTGYSSTLAATGGTLPYSWMISSGSLPAGLTLSSTGVITGTPNSPGTSGFTIQATDATTPTPQTVKTAFSITVSAAPTPTKISTNWSGYVAGTGPFTEANGTFTVPNLETGTPTSDSLAEWVGIDGSGNSSLIQAGIQESIDPSNPNRFTIQPWWEILPAPETDITSVTVNAGDRVTVTIGKISGTGWGITLTDDTNGESFTTDQTYTGPGASAEWIVEAPTVSGQQSVLAPYTPDVTFSDLGITPLNTSLTEILMVQSAGQVSTPSAFTSSGFNVAYGGVAPAAP